MNKLLLPSDMLRYRKNCCGLFLLYTIHYPFLILIEKNDSAWGNLRYQRQEFKYIFYTWGGSFAVIKKRSQKSTSFVKSVCIINFLFSFMLIAKQREMVARYMLLVVLLTERS